MNQIYATLDQEEREDRELRSQWQLGDYVGDCPHCGRSRLCECPNGKHRCEKCNWCPEDGNYAPDV